MRLAQIFLYVFGVLFLGMISTATQGADIFPSHRPHSYATAVKVAVPAVVNIYTDNGLTQRQNQRRHYGPSLPYGYYYGRPTQDLVHPTRRLTLGSGVIVDRKGDVLTNYHIVKNARRILVALHDGRRSRATVVGSDRLTDLAILHIKLSRLHPAKLGNSDNLQVGDVVLAIGNPFGLGQTVTQGIVSAIGRHTIGLNPLENYIQTDAAINPGSSGGALVNTKGELVGINTAIYTRSGGYQGIGFAIPVNVALNVLHQILKTGKVVRGWVGIELQTVNRSIAHSLKLKAASGVVVVDVIPDSPAQKAGLMRGDVLMKLNGHPIKSAPGLSSYIAQRQPGSELNMTFLRNNVKKQVRIKIGKRPNRPVINHQIRVPKQWRRGQQPDTRWR